MLGGLGALLGTLGRWAAGPGGKPAPTQNAFWLMLSALVTLVTAAALLVMLAFFAQFDALLQSTAESVGYALPYSSASIFTWPIATHLVWLLFWQVLAWRLTRKAAPLATLRLPLLLALALSLFSF